jgi:hypothetical protein
MEGVAAAGPDLRDLAESMGRSFESLSEQSLSVLCSLKLAIFDSMTKTTKCICLMFSVNAVVIFVTAWTNFIVLDEIAHIPAGLSHWQTGSFALDRVNPPLARMLATVPLLFAKPNSDYRLLDEAQGIRREWFVGRAFIDVNGERSFDLFRIARIPGVAWSIVGGWFVFLWSSELYGKRGGLLSLFVWCFDPTVLGFSSVVTSDVPATVLGLIACFTFRNYLKNGSWSTAFMAGITLGIAELAKFTLILLYGVFAILWTIDYLGKVSAGRQMSLLRCSGQGVLILVISIELINMGYGFRGTCVPLGEFSFVSRSFNNRADVFQTPGNRFRGSWLEGVPVPFPADYIQGIDLQKRDLEGEYDSYLNGRWRHTGWWYYYLEALFIKEPIGLIVLVVWSFYNLCSRRLRTDAFFEEISLALPALVYLFSISSETGMNHHMRYVLPAFPFLMISLGKLVGPESCSRVRNCIIFALASWIMACTMLVCPHFISYFNEFAGGPENGDRFLLDSNIDWGQDLLRLRSWMAIHPEATPLSLAYFNALDPRHFGIDYRLAPFGYLRHQPEASDLDGELDFGPRPGYFAISVNYLRGVTYLAPTGTGRFVNIARRDTFSYFNRFTPMARIGYSIRIFHLTLEQVNEIRAELKMPLL